MAAVAAQSAVAEPITRTYPQISDRIMDELRQQQRDLLRQPERAEPPAELYRTERFVFRSQPRTHRRIVHRLDVMPSVEGPEDRRGAFFLSRWQKRHKDDPAYGEKIERLVDHLGGPMLAFTEIRGRFECFFATDDAEVAAYVRDLMTRKVGEFAEVYEVNGRARIVVGDEAFPNTPLGWQMARDHAQANGITNLEVVEDKE